MSVTPLNAEARHHGADRRSSREARAYMFRRWLRSRATRWDYRMTLRTLLEELRPGPDENILEIGSGPGTWTREVASRAKKVVAVDISENMIAEALGHTRGLPVQFIHSDFLESSPEGLFDKIFSLRAIEYISDRDMLARKIAGLLAPGGTVVLVTKTRFSVWRGRMRLLDPGSWPLPWVYRRRGGHNDRDQGTMHSPQFLPSPGQLARAFEPYGLAVTKVRPVVIRFPIFKGGFYEFPIIPDALAPPFLGLSSILFKLCSYSQRFIASPLLLLSESYSITLKSVA